MPRYCRGCGIHLDQFRPECRSCNSRRSLRKRRAEGFLSINQRRGLEDGYLPAARVVSAINKAIGLEPEDDWSLTDERLAPLAELGDFHDIKKQMTKRQHVPFDLVDAVLCKLEIVDLWLGDLSDLYESVALTVKCGDRDCDGVIEIGRNVTNNRRYCNDICRNREQRKVARQQKVAA